MEFLFSTTVRNFILLAELLDRELDVKICVEYVDRPPAQSEGAGKAA
jgi:hypothetical protein